MNIYTVPGFDHYRVIGTDVYGKYKERGALKPGKRDVISLSDGHGKRYSLSRLKVVWAAMHNVDPRRVPREYSFFVVNGVVTVETFSHRMSRVKKRYYSTVQVMRDDYDYIERWAQACKAVIDGEPDARLRLFSVLNSKRDWLIRYGLRYCGARNAEMYADAAIAKVYECLLARTYAKHHPWRR